MRIRIISRWCLRSMSAYLSQQGYRSVPEFYEELKGLIDELEMHQPTVTVATTPRGYLQDLAVSKFLSGLSPFLRSQL